LRPFADLPSIRAEIEEQAHAQLVMIGDGATTVSVGLRAGAECLARQIVAVYGPKVDVTVGLLPFPLRPVANRSCLVGGWPPGSVPFLKASLDIQPNRVAQGDTVKGTVRFTNGGVGQLHLDTSSNFSIYVFAVGADVPVGASEGGSMGTGLLVELAPGQSKDVPAFGGTASCDPALGYVLPTGQYQARALIDFSPPEGGVHVFWTDPLEVEVVAPPPP
jgi:hypothetical protein